MDGPETSSRTWDGRLWRQLSRWARTHPTALSYGTSSAAAVALYAVSAPLELALYGVPVLAGLLVLALQCAALVVAPRFPIVAVGVFTAATVLLSLRTQPSSAPWPWTMTGIVCFALLVGSIWAVSGWRLGVVAYVVPVVALFVPMATSPEAVTAAHMIVALGVGVAAALVGALVRVSHQLRQEREHAATEVERRMVIEERQRIARELHDVVAHGLSLIQVQANFARYRLPHMPDDVAAEVEDIARTARAALGEMREMLGALRGDEPVERAPQRTLDDLPALVEETARAGVTVRLRLDAPPMPTAVGIAAYRIAQEAISNAVRHAPGAPVEVSADAHDGALLVTIENGWSSGTGSEPSVCTSGHGLIGMRERASILHGTLAAGQTASGGFRVSATLPLEPPLGRERGSAAE
ncbi:sensor histidine kinase [Promicromonospora sukumoe]|uniref:sensor histidine kinase n=1 Tax=Promicromonospora sukumoe TaxID=88382 RepID=UPI003661A161